MIEHFVSLIFCKTCILGTNRFKFEIKCDLAVYAKKGVVYVVCYKSFTIL